MRLMKEQKLYDGGRQLTEALLSGKLSAGRAEEVRGALDYIAQQTVLSPRIIPDDPYGQPYVVQSGDALVKIVSPRRGRKLYVDWRIIPYVNRMSDPTLIKPGQRIKLVRGPFHAVIHKRAHMMDVYLQAGSLPKLVVRSFKVGLGKDDSTPVGRWRIRYNGKQRHATWYPPEGGRSIAWGESGYPLGKDGYWIALEGTDEATRHMTSYGIHGTDDVASIGRDESRGCIRMREADIVLVYAMMYGGDEEAGPDGKKVIRGFSTVDIRP